MQAIAACLLAICSLTVVAQNGSNDNQSGVIEEITVTATKRDEGLQDVPISVTAFSQSELDLRGFTGLAGIQESTPNLNFSVQSAGQNVARVTLRGIGTETLVGGGDPGVALHIDGIYVGRNSVAAGDIFDVERVEVLRGPQGTLYGRNATGGSINIVTKRPGSELEGFADITLGNYDNARLRAAVNVPLSDNVSSRITLFSDQRDGFLENLFNTGRDSFDKDSKGGRVQVLWNTDSGNEILVRGYHSNFGGVGPGSRFLGADINTPNGYPAGYLVGVSAGPAPPAGGPVVADLYNGATTTTGQSLLPLPGGFFDIRKDAPEFLDQTIQGFDVDGTFDLTDTIVLKSLTSYQTNDNEILVDADGSELPLETRQRATDASQYSQEFNLISQNDSAFQWILGAYFYHEELTEEFETLTPAGLLALDAPLPPGAVPGGGGTRQFRVTNHEVDSYALFAQLTYDVSDRLSLTAGLRQTWDDKDQNRETGGLQDLTNNIRFMSPGIAAPLPPDSGSESFSELTYRLSADYAVTDDSLLYASIARGYKSGGFDFNGGQLLNGTDQVPYQPEFVDALEIGSKNKFFDNRLLVNLTAFYYDYSDLQVFRLTAFGPLTDNAAESTIKGLEGEFEWAASDALRFDVSFGYLDATYDQYTIDRPPTDFSGKRLNYAPEWTGHAGAEYSMPMAGNNELLFRLDWSYRSEIFFDRANSPLDTQDSYSLFNARVRYDTETWFADLFVQNLTDEEYVTGQLINPPFACGCRTVNVGAPMTYGVTFGARF